ncbi:Alpha/Beta hydrolase protein [Sphaerosporella brunnea]|uniref:Carboxylic ester hydrolase n=1 Tax=Sphaerosporella brunnea TaxID=1250544 RepID=A0A5J5ETM7_9PEZI|nr:Alpha/Beta hydrolase protein [Sphaerosporella brunnea]
MSFHHASLNARLSPVRISTAPGILQYRNIKFASIPERFAHSELINDWNGAAIGTETHGPRCPQVPYDLNTLFRIPAAYVSNRQEEESEFECLNLSVTVPEGAKAGDNLPVLIWIHGGSFVATVGSVESGLCDPAKLLCTAIASGLPLVYVAVNYRLNFLGFTYFDDERCNFGLFDQKHAIEWVHRHIHGFGGDPNNITLGGESAGAIAANFHTLSAHSHLLQRVILQSGTATTVPAQPPAVGATFRTRLMAALSVSSIGEMRALPAAAILAGQAAINVHTLFPINSGPFWRSPQNSIWSGEVLIGDCADEWSLFKTGISAVADPSSIFPDLPASETLLSAYGRDHKGVLRFTGDAKFHYHTEKYYRGFLERNPRVWRYIFDAPNPFVPEAGAHHAVDLLYLFAPASLTPTQEALGEEMRRAWIRFVAGAVPWDKGLDEKVLLLDQQGCRVVEASEVNRRRNVELWKVLDNLGWDAVAPVVGEVVRGRIRFE